MPPLAHAMQKATLPPVLRESHLNGVKLLKRGKVRDVYEHEDRVVLVATDRLSAFDVVLPDPIPGKGLALTQLSNHWFNFAKSLIANHLVETDFDRFPAALRAFPELRGRTVLARKAQPLAIECIVRGYLSGSGWKDYKKTGTVCGIPLPKGLQESSRLPQPIFTPSTKAEQGHDENITDAQAEGIVGKDVYRQVRDASLRIYGSAAEAALKKGVIIADTKFEFGTTTDGLILIDEVLTPDSSRFWPSDEYRVGTSPPSFDKQFVRDYLEKIHWDKTPPAPALPGEVIEGTTRRYLEAYRRITGRDLVA